MNETVAAPKRPLAPKQPASAPLPRRALLPLVPVKFCATGFGPLQTETQKPATNLSNMILLNCFPGKTLQQNKLSFQAPIQAKNPSLVIPKPVMPIAPKVPHGKMPIYPAPKKILPASLKSGKLDQNQELNSKPVCEKSDSRNSTKSSDKIPSRDFYSANFQDVKQSINSESHQIYLTKTPTATNIVNPSNKLLMPLCKPSNFVIINPMPRQNERPISSLDPKVGNSTTQLVSIHPSSIFPIMQNSFLSKYVPIQPKTTTPDLQKSSSNFISDSRSNVLANKYSRIGRTRQKHGCALRKPRKKGTRLISRVLSMNQYVEPPDVISNIPVKIERVDAACDDNNEMPFEFKGSGISDTETDNFCFVPVSSVTGPHLINSQDVNIGSCSKNIKKEKELFKTETENFHFVPVSSDTSSSLVNSRDVNIGDGWRDGALVKDWTMES